jgi:hydrogenase maturation protease
VIPQPQVPPVLIAGIGNLLLQDDGFGPQAIAQLESEYEFGSEVELLDIGTPALDFIDYLVGRQLVILLDALCCGGEPGDLLLYDQAQLRQHLPGMRLSAHQPCLNETLFAAETAGIALKRVLLIGVVGSEFEVGTELGSHVRAAMPKALELVRQKLAEQGVQIKLRKKPLAQDVWWNRDAEARRATP